MLSHSVLNPLSPQANAISNLFIFTLIASLLIIFGIMAVLTYTLIRFRQRPGQGDPPQTYGQVPLEIAWTAIPFFLLLVVFGVVVNTMRIAAPGGDPPPDLTVIGHQWWWELRYPSGVVSANEIHIPVGRRFYVDLKSADVIHSLWVPQLGPKMDLVPGQTNHLWLEADKAGTYEGACAEFCGGPHAWMLVRVIAQPPAQFDAWQQQQLRDATTPPPGLARQGAMLFGQLTCASCHAISGNGSSRAGNLIEPAVGPNLTHLAGRQTLAAGRLANTGANLAAWLRNPDTWKPGVHMPNLHLTPHELHAMTAYLESLK